MNKQQELLKKLKALSEEGLGGEKENADVMLKRLMTRYGITLEELESDEEDFEFFKFDPLLRRLFVQIAVSVYGVNLKVQRGTAKRKASIVFLITKAQKLEIEAKFATYKHPYLEHLSLFNSAFFHKNNIFATDAPDGEGPKMEQEKLMKMVNMMGSIEKTDYLKQLKG